MQRDEYLVQVTVIEARHLAASENGGVCDPFVRIKCANAETQATTTEEGTPTPIWNQSFTFSELFMSPVELQTFELIIECLHYNNFMSNRLIGQFSIGLSTLHKQRNHEIFQAWLTLLNPEVSANEPQGYLQVNAFIVGPNDNPPIHTIGEKMDVGDDDEDEFDLMTPEQRAAKKEAMSKINILSTPNVARKSYQLAVNVFKGESLKKKVESGLIDAFASVRVGGFVEPTPVVKGSQDPDWNTKFNFPVFMPILNDKILVRVWDRNRGGRDRLVAQVPGVPSDSDHFNISALLSRGGQLPCRWFNMYGHPPNENTTGKSLKLLMGLAKKSYTGSAYFGRILLSLSIDRLDDPEYSLERSNPYQEPPTNEYCLRCNVYDLNNTKGCGDNVWVRASIGQFEAESPNAHKKPGTNSYQWGTSYTGEKLREIKQFFPEDDQQTPDVFLDLFTETTLSGTVRIGYIRKKVSELQGEDNPRWIPFRSTDMHSESAGNSPGLILCSIGYGHMSAMGRRIIKSRPRKIKKYLQICMYGGYDLAPSKDEDDVTANVTIQFAGSQWEMPEKLIVPKCRNPLWKWRSKRMSVELSENLSFEENLMVTVGTKVKTLGITRNAKIGHFSVPLHHCVKSKRNDMFFFHLVNESEEGVSQGKVLAMFLITDDKFGDEINMDFTTLTCNLSVAVIGARGVKPPMKNPILKISIPGYKWGKDEKNLQDAVQELTEDASTAGQSQGSASNPNFLQFVEFQNIELPEDPRFLPIMKIDLEDKSFFGGSIKYTQTSLVPYAHWVKEERDKSEAMNAYKRAFTEKDTIEQIPCDLADILNVSTEALNRNIDVTDYSDAKKSDDEEAEEKEPDMPLLSNYGFVQTIQFDKRDKDLLVEEKKREERKDELTTLQKANEAEVESAFAKTGLIPAKLDKKRKQIRKGLEFLEEGIMDERRFWGVADDYDSDEDDYDYGRPIMRTGNLDDILELPYMSMALFKQTSNKKNLSVHKIGEKTDAILKLAIKIEVIEDEYSEDEIQDSDESEEQPEPMKSKQKSPRHMETEITDEEEHKRYPMDFFNKDISRKNCPLFAHFKGSKSFKTRIYLLRMLNLSAVDNKPDLVGLASGYNAKSSADAFPEIFVGDRRTDASSGKTKYIKEPHNRIEGTLNPEFFTSWEFDMELPTDWRMQFYVWDHSSFGMHGLIGVANFDLEDRYFANKTVSETIMCETLLKAYQVKIDNGSTDVAKIFTKMAESVNIRRAQVQGAELFKVPVEYRQLLHPKKATAQGLLEMWIETWTSQEARRTPMTRLVKPLPEKYELRLVLWNVYDVPQGEKDVVDIFLEAQWDAEGWQAETLKRETDCHCGVEDGKAVFNWRMKFPFTLPCVFPRIRIMAYNFNTFHDDEPLTEVVIELTREFRRLRKEGKLEMVDQEVPMSLPNKPDKPGGKLLFSLWAMTQSEADQRPVGQGQEEPNRDPELEAPTEGRGMLDFLKGTPFDIKLPWLNFGFLAKILALFMFVFLNVVLWIYPGIMIK